MHNGQSSLPLRCSLTSLFTAGLFLIASCDSPQTEPDDGQDHRFETSSDQSEQTGAWAQPMSSGDAKAYLRKTKIQELNLENTSIPDAIQVINQTLRQQAPDTKRPIIRLSSNWPGDGPPPHNIKELRVRDIPVGVALRYMCDQTRSVFWVYQGAFRQMEDETYERFLESRISKFKVKDSNLLDAVDMLKAATDEVEFDLQKPGFTYPSNVYRRAEITRDAVANRVRGISMQDATVGDALREICRQAGASYQFFEGDFLILPDEIEITSPSGD